MERRPEVLRPFRWILQRDKQPHYPPHRGTTSRAWRTGEISHTLDSSTFITSVGGDSFSITRDSPDAHRYSLRPRSLASTFSFSALYSTTRTESLPIPESITSESTQAWNKYWAESGFVDVLTNSSDARAEELQRRVVLSRYLMRVNEAGENPPQEASTSYFLAFDVPKLTVS